MKGRPALSRPGWHVLVGLVVLRADYRCEWCGARGRLMDPEHAVPAGQGGADSWANVWWACRPCHDLKTFGTRDAAKLEVTPLGDGRFAGVRWTLGVIVDAREFGRAPTRTEREVLEALV